MTVPTRGYGVTFDDLDMEDSHSHNPTPAPPTRQPLDALEVFEYIRGLNDPEHPLTLEQLNVVSLDLISVDDGASTVDVRFTPTIPHCSMATLIGLCIRVKLQRLMVKATPCKVITMECGHSPFFSNPEELVEHLEAIAAA